MAQPVRLRVPHTLALLFFIMSLAWLATWILPQGRFDTVLTLSLLHI